MPYRTLIADLDLKIENLRTAIEAFRTRNASRAEMDRLLSELARVKADRLRLMLRQVNIGAEQRHGQTIAPSGPEESEAITVGHGNPDG